MRTFIEVHNLASLAYIIPIVSILFYFYAVLNLILSYVYRVVKLFLYYAFDVPNSAQWGCPICDTTIYRSITCYNCGYDQRKGVIGYSTSAPRFRDRYEYEQWKRQKEYFSGGSEAEYVKVEELLRRARIESEKARADIQEAQRIKKEAYEELQRIKSEINASQKHIKDPYSVLGVHRNDSLETIKEVYLKLATIYHPDKHSNADYLAIQQKNSLMARINSAYEWILKQHGK
ncbi:Heat shock protein DnaJ [Candidatus Magnetoovum chiemensis]|nr:Heat shock protein DnaJ [Candidatus Magnetoovum chiemensis]